MRSKRRRRTVSRWGVVALAAALIVILLPLSGKLASAATGNSVTVFYKPTASWSQVNIHYAPDGGSWTAVPGIGMDAECAGWYRKTIDLGPATFKRRYTNAATGIDSFALVTVSSSATFTGIPNGGLHRCGQR